MTITEYSWKATSKQDLRIPMPHVGKGVELFTFSGVAHFGKLKGTGPSWEGGHAYVQADYTGVIAKGQAIEPHGKNYTADVHLASIKNDEHAVNTGWAVDDFELEFSANKDGTLVLVADGLLVIKATIAVRDIDAVIHRLSYHAHILGKVVKYEHEFDG